MADFNNTQIEINKYISDNFNKYLTDTKSTLQINEFTDDYIDLDKHTKSKTMFFNFDNYAFETLSSDSRKENINYKVYIVCRNGTEKDIKKNLLNLVSAFYTFFYDESYGKHSFNNLCSWAEITEVNLFNEPDLKSAEINIEIKKEEII